MTYGLCFPVLAATFPDASTAAADEIERTYDETL